MLDRPRHLRLTTLACAVVLAIAWAMPAGAATIEARTEAEMTQASAAVVLAQVQSSVTVQTEQGLKTRHTLKVESWWKGEGPQSITLSQVGGTLGERTVLIPGDMKLEPEERIVVFLVQGPDSYWSFLLGWSVFHVDGSGPDATIHRDAAELGLMRRTKAGLLRPVSLEDLAIPDTLSTLRRRVAASMGGER